MTKRRAVVRRLEEDFANAIVPPQGNQVTPQGNQVPPQEQARVIPPPPTDGEIRSTFFCGSRYDYPSTSGSHSSLINDGSRK